MPLIILGILVILFFFFYALYFVVKAAVNNSEELREIKIMLMKTQKEERDR